MTERDKLRQEIVDKFKSLSRLSSAANIPYKRIMNILNDDEDNIIQINKLRRMCNNTKKDETGLILEKDRKLIRLCILKNYKNYTEFCNNNNEYDSVYLSNIIGGRLVVVSEKYKSLVELLTNEYNLDKRILKRISN